MLEDFKESKAKYFVIALIILIVLGIVLIVHFNNKTLVSGNDKEITEKTTTKKVKEKKKKTTTTTTTKKVETKEEVKQDVVAAVTEDAIYKSTVDKNTEFVYNYKLTDEIIDSDSIIASSIAIPQKLINTNLVSLYDISLYDINLVKKNVKNSLILVRVPINNELRQYDDYKVVYINDDYELTDEVFHTFVYDDYIEFETTHLSMYGIIGTKKAVENKPTEPEKRPINNPVDEPVEQDPTEEPVEEKIHDFKVYKNGVFVSDESSIIFAKDDEVDLKLVDQYDNNIYEDYTMYYALGDEESTLDTVEYIEYNEENKKIFSNIENPATYKLYLKVVSSSNECESAVIGTINIYDIEYIYDRSEELTEDVNIGTIENSDYSDQETNNDIVITNVNTENDPVENTVAVNLFGNIYLVEETDISNLKITGHLVIDTESTIYTKNSEGTNYDYSNIYTITIKSNTFVIDGETYTYEIVGEEIVIKKTSEPETTVNASDIFGENMGVTKGNDMELIIKLREELGTTVEDQNEPVTLSEPVQENSEEEITEEPVTEQANETE